MLDLQENVVLADYWCSSAENATAVCEVMLKLGKLPWEGSVWSRTLSDDPQSIFLKYTEGF